MTVRLRATPRVYPPGDETFGRPHLFRPVSTPKKSPPGALPTADDQPSEAPMEAVVCRQCLYEITSAAEVREIHGSHTHTFANPEGIVFEIGCYQEAWGCGYVGGASTEFTWFSGYVWRIAVCVNCHAHLGWRFSAPAGHFFHGLITSRIRSHTVAPSH